MSCQFPFERARKGADHGAEQGQADDVPDATKDVVLAGRSAQEQGACERQQSGSNSPSDGHGKWLRL